MFSFKARKVSVLDSGATMSLDGGADGLDVARRVILEAPHWLTAGGSLLFETSEDQAAAALESVTAAGLNGPAS